jgi:electron transfer flavoprotein alpha subunit
MSGYLVYLEQRDGIVRKASMEAWNLAREAASLEGSPGAVAGILVGPADTGDLAAHLSGNGTVYHAHSAELALYHPEHSVRIVSDLFGKAGFTAIVFADTALSRDLAPRLSVRLRASLLSGCPDSFPDSTGVCRRTVYGGFAVASFFPLLERRIYTLQMHGALSKTSQKGSISIVPFNEYSHETAHPSALVRRIAINVGQPDVAEAEIVVAGGRGMGSREGFAMLEELAGLLGGSVGASRAVVDEGWRPHGEQVGQTGKSVAPRLYLACGISGSVQHLAGIGGAGMVVAINSDPHAPIFEAADYGIVGDVHIILPRLAEEVREFLKKK